jgi:hypothetical protein
MPPEFNFQYNGRENGNIQDTDNTPSIFVTSHDILPQSYLMNQAQPHRPPTLTVQTHNLNQNRASLSPGLSPMDHGSPASTYHTALNTPVSPSPSQFMPDDDMTSIYSSQDAFQNSFYSSSQDPSNAIMSNSGGAFTFTVGAQHTG